MNRDGIIILPPDDPNKKRLGYKIYEIPWDRDGEEYLKEVMSPDGYGEWLWYKDTGEAKPK